MNGKIYGIKNNRNNKLYIGQTTLELKERFARHTAKNETNKNTLISKVIKSFGKENFEIFLIRDGFKTIEELNQAEKHFIEKFNTMNPNGYNLCPGGQEWRRKPNISEEELKVAIREYVHEGKSLRDLAEKYKTDRRLLSKKIKESGYEIRSKSHNLPNRTSKVTKEIMIDLYINKNMKIKDIAELLNVSPMTINRAKRRYNLSR